MTHVNSLAASAGSPALGMARSLCRAGLSVIPVRDDGSKAPALHLWTPFQTRHMSEEELEQYFHDGSGVAIVGGQVSGGLEIIDFDEPSLFPLWCHAIKAAGSAGLLESLVEVETPSGGRHLYYRCPEGIAGNTVLAARDKPDPTTGKRVLIETRGERGYVLAPGSPPECHELHRPYTLSRGSFADIPTLSVEDRALLLNTARSFDRRSHSVKVLKSPRLTGGLRPGDEFNRSATWEFLERHGWQQLCSVGGLTYWRRPGKDHGISATTNYVGRNLLFVFSGNAQPFEPGTGYTKFTAYTLLNHGGDFSAAANDLLGQGMGTAAMPLRLDDIGNADRFLRAYGQDVRWVGTLNKWLIWTGKRWEIDQMEAVLGLAKKVARSIVNEVKHGKKD